MRPPRRDGQLDELRTQIAEDLGSLNNLLGRSVPRGLWDPLRTLGQDAGRLWRGSPWWVVGAMAGIVAGLIVAGRHRVQG